MTAAREAKAKAQPAVLAAMGHLRAAVLANNGVTDETKMAVHRAEAPYKSIEERLEKQTPQRAAQVWALLTTAQGARLRRAGRFGDMTDEAFCAMMAPKLYRRGNGSARALGMLYRAYGLFGEEIPRAIACGTPLFTAWQQLPQDRAEAQRAEVTRRLLVLPETGILLAQPDDAAVRIITLTVLTQKSLHYLNPHVPLPPLDGVEMPQVQATVADIRVLNLVNTLYLTPEQTRALLGIQNRARADYGVLLARQMEAVRAALPTMRQVRDAYAAGTQPAPALREQMQGLEAKRQEFAAADTSIDKKYLDELKQLLTANQMSMIGNFVPCTVPVQSLTNPERVGQAESTDGMEKALARLREAPEARLEKGVATLQGMIRKHFEKKHYKEEKILAVLATVPGIVAEIRAMEDAEFALKKQELAESLAVPAHIAAGKELDGRVLTYLLAPNLTPLLQGRLGGQAT
jgi:hypothetical protein